MAALRILGRECDPDFCTFRDLAERTTTELSDLKPRDRIDVQSFIWVVGNYKEETEKPMA